MIDYRLIDHNRQHNNQTYREVFTNDFPIYMKDNHISLKTFKINRRCRAGLTLLLENIDKQLFTDIQNNAKQFYYLYYENLSEPKISDTTLTQFCYFRIFAMIKDILFKDISYNHLIPLSDIRKGFYDVLYEKIKIISLGNKIYFKDYIANLKLSLGFLLKDKNNSIETHAYIRKEIQNSLNGNSIDSLFYEIYLQLLTIFSRRFQKTSEKEFEYVINLTLLFLYLFLTINDFDNSYRHSFLQKLHQSNQHRLLNIKNFSLLSVLISYNKIDLLHKTLIFSQTNTSDQLYHNKNIVDSYLTLYDISK